MRVWVMQWAPLCVAAAMGACGLAESDPASPSGGSPSQGGSSSSVAGERGGGPSVGDAAGAPSSAGASGSALPSGGASEPGNAGRPSTGGAPSGAGADSAAGVPSAGSDAAGAGGDPGSSEVCSGEALDCGCGCCPGAKSGTRCYYPDLGEALATAVPPPRSAEQCALAGCSAGTYNVCCVAPSSGGDTGTVQRTEFTGGGYYRILVFTEHPLGPCLTLSSPVKLPVNDRFRVDLPEHWQFERASAQGCASGSGDVIGALGTIAAVGTGSACALNVHVTVFISRGAGDVRAARIDGDAIPVDYPYLCR